MTELQKMRAELMSQKRLTYWRMLDVIARRIGVDRNTVRRMLNYADALDKREAERQAA